MNYSYTELEPLKTCLTEYVESITRHSKGRAYECPIPDCGSGTKQHKTGAFNIDPKSNGTTWHCFSCGNGGDIFDLCRLVEGCSEAEARQRIADRYGRGVLASTRQAGQATAYLPIKENRRTPEAVTSPDAPSTEQVKPDFSKQIDAYAAALKGSEGESYLKARGFTPETMARFKLGFDAAGHWVTIPYDAAGTYYGRRSTIQREQVHNNLSGVPVPLFNGEALDAGGVVYVVESPLCAISIEQEGGRAVALAGTSGKQRLLTRLKQTPKLELLVMVVALDNDVPGRAAAADLGKELTERGVMWVDGTAAIMGNEQDSTKPEYRKDINEVLQKDGGAALRAGIDRARVKALQLAQVVLVERNKHFQRSVVGKIDSFLKAVQDERYKPISTGLAGLDKVLEGGFLRQQLVLLGAAPATGKTAFAQWLFEGMAASGRNSCLYINLEMSSEQLMARSIARYAAAAGKSITPTQVLKGYQWTDEQRETVFEAAAEYGAAVGDRMIYECRGTDLDSICELMEDEAKYAEGRGQEAPCVVLDYLQIVTSGTERLDAAELIKRTIARLKSYAIRHNTVVFVIMAHNRTSNSAGAVTMESGRDTSAIEYSADCQLGLTFTRCMTDKGKKPDELEPEERRFLTLKVTKTRGVGGIGKTVDLYFDGAKMNFLEIPKGCIVVNGKLQPLRGQRSI